MDAPAPKSSNRYLFALALLILIIGGLAWLTQQMPNWRTRIPKPGPEAAKEKAPVVCRFPVTRAVWHPEWKNYAREYEKGQHGHYDFPFENPSDQEGEIGLFQVNCACSSILATLTPAASWDRWTELRKTEPAVDLPAEAASWVGLIREEDTSKTPSAAQPTQTSLTLPPRCKGVIRLTWDGKGSPGEFQRLLPRLWAQPKGNTKERLFLELEVIARIAGPVQFHPHRIELGDIGVGDSAVGNTIYVWSATRKDPKIEFTDIPPLFQVSKRALDAKEIKALQERILEEEKYTSDILFAWALTPKVFERREVDGKIHLHDLGPFSHPIGVTVDDEPLDNGPHVTGVVRSDIVIGEERDRGRVDLGTFDPARGSGRKVILWSDAKAKLTYERHDPTELNIKLTHLDKESTDRRNKWLLEVSVPPDALVGPFPEKSAVYLRLQGTPTRLIRVPVVGTAKHTGR